MKQVTKSVGKGRDATDRTLNVWMLLHGERCCVSLYRVVCINRARIHLAKQHNKTKQNQRQQKVNRKNERLAASPSRTSCTRSEEVKEERERAKKNEKTNCTM